MKRAGLRDLMPIALVLCLSALLVSTIYAGIIVPGSVRMTDTPGGAEMTQFASGISVVYLVFDYSDMHNEEFMVRVYYYSGEMLFEQSKVYTGSGTESVEISPAGGGAFLNGRYITNLYSGLFPISSIWWEVGGAPKIKTFLPCIVKQWPPSITPTPTRTPAVTPTPSPTPGYDLYEPNNSFSMAYPILSAEMYFAYINPGSDLDYFRFDVQTSYPIAARLTIPDPENMTYGLDLYDADYNRLISKANLAGEETITITFDPPQTGRYYLKVYSIQNRFDPSRAYELRVVFDRAPTPTPSPTSTPTVIQPTTGTPTSTPTPTPTPTSGAGGWVIECVDCPRQFSNMTDRSLRLDAEGHPHIAYGEEHLYHAWHDGANWHYEVVDNSPYVGQHASLALDAGGYPHISYYDYHLKYAYKDASGWNSETEESECDVGNYTSLALDGNGYPHISYYDEWNEDLKYAYQDASGWHIETVDSERDVGEDSSLALDGNGYPHISYYDETNYDLKYAYQDASGWHIETVDSEGRVGYDTSLALDGDGYPHISYYDDYPKNDLKYAYQDASGWHIETVDRSDERRVGN